MKYSFNKKPTHILSAAYTINSFHFIHKLMLINMYTVYNEHFTRIIQFYELTLNASSW